MNKDFKMYHGDDSYKPICDKVGVNLTIAFMKLENNIRKQFGKDIQIMVEPFVSAVDGLKKIDIIILIPFKRVTLVEKTDGEIELVEGGQD